MSTNDDPIGLFVFLTGAGPFLFYNGLKSLKEKRIIENTPTSTIRGMSMGLVEVKGKVLPYGECLTSPFEQKPCVYYRYKIQELRSSGKRTRWVTIQEGDSSHVPFVLEDDTGKVIIDSTKAKTHLQTDNVIKNKSFVGISKSTENLEDIMTRFSIKSKNILGFKKSFKFTEWFLEPDEEIYVLGHAQTIKENKSNFLSKSLDELSKDPDILKKIDVDKDGKISKTEWAVAKKKLKLESLKKVVNSNNNYNAVDIKIGYHKDSNMFIISDKSEKELVSSFSIKTLLSVIGGPILTIIGLFYILNRFNLF